MTEISIIKCYVFKNICYQTKDADSTPERHSARIVLNSGRIDIAFLKISLITYDRRQRLFQSAEMACHGGGDARNLIYAGLEKNRV